MILLDNDKRPDGRRPLFTARPNGGGRGKMPARSRNSPIG